MEGQGTSPLVLQDRGAKNMKRIIVTGATSYIAAALIKRLLDEKYYIYAIVRPNSVNRNKLPQNRNLTVLEIPMAEYSLLNTMDLGEVDAVYHFAWNGVRGTSRTDSLLQAGNIQWTMDLLDVVCRKHIPYFIGMGSQAEYGITGTQLVTEDTKLNPVEPYGSAKTQIYQYGMNLTHGHGFTFLWARIFSAYGYGESPGTLIMSSLYKMLRNEAVELSPCEHLWDYLYRDDLAEALYQLYAAGSPSGAYNISYGSPEPLKNFIEKMKSMLHSDSRLLYGAVPYGEYIVQMNPSIEKICSVTQWKPETDFETGIQKLYREMQNAGKCRNV